MRLRKNPLLQTAIEGYRDIVLTEQGAREKFNGREKIRLELGCGKGGFICGMASLYPAELFVGVENQLDVAYYAAVKVRAAASPNVYIINADAGQLGEWFLPGQVTSIYINFCDPWPKDRHAKRRLVGRRFLEKYREILASGGSLRFKTDNQALFSFALEELTGCGFQIREQIEDLHASTIENPVWTEYEKKFHTLGLPVFFCEAAPVDRGET